MTTLTLHPTFKRTRDGYVPMVTVRGARGRMIGSRVPPRGTATFQHPLAARVAARLVAWRVYVKLGRAYVRIG
jgi:hypothetical protein